MKYPCSPVPVAAADALVQFMQAHGQLEDAGGLAYLGRLAKETPTAANIVAYADIVRERSVLRQLIEGRRFLDNCYAEVVRPGGNPSARAQLDQAMQVVDANWRGIGVIPTSGFALRAAYAEHDARRRFPIPKDEERRRAGQMPPGCDCAQVVLGKIYPDQCRLFGSACTPRTPVGPCMVSDEGACRIWWGGGVRTQQAS